MQWIEPIWKMLWANKALLAVLWELYPNHANLLPAYFDGPRDLTRYVKKPKMAREGANITYVGDTRIETGGDYGEEGFVYQALAPVPVFDGNYAVVGSWVVDGVACGMGIRESDGPITDNQSRFVPHLLLTGRRGWGLGLGTRQLGDWGLGTASRPRPDPRTPHRRATSGSRKCLTRWVQARTLKLPSTQSDIHGIRRPVLFSAQV